MTVIRIELHDAVARDIHDLVHQMGRPVAAIVHEAIQQYWNDHKRPAAKHRVNDILPGRGLGEILKPWTSRAELLENFYERD